MLERVIKTILKAESVILRTETNYINYLRIEAEKAAEEKPEEYDQLMSALIKEGKRIHKKPTDTFDEEEAQIFMIIKRGKKKK